MKFSELKKGDVITCVNSNSEHFTENKDYAVTSHGNIVTDRKYRLKVSEIDSINKYYADFKISEICEKSVFTKEDTGKTFKIKEDLMIEVFYGAYDWSNYMSENYSGKKFVLETIGSHGAAPFLDGYYITKDMVDEVEDTKEIKGGKDMKELRNKKTMIEVDFDESILEVGMEIKDGFTDKYHKIESLDEYFITCKDMVIERNNIGDIIPSQDDELIVSSQFNRVPFISGQKNYYVAFDFEANRYKRYSEDVIKRIDTIFISPEDAKTLRDELNGLIEPRILKMKRHLTELEIQELEAGFASCYNTIKFVPNEKNYYVSFDSKDGRYKRYSEDKIRRVGTIFLSPEDAKKLRDRLNEKLVD